MSAAQNQNPERGCSAWFFNILAILALLGAFVVVLLFFSWFNNPDAVPENLRPLVIPTVPVLPSETPTSLPGSATPTSIPSSTPLPTNTLAPSSTPEPTETPFSLVTPPTDNPRATATPEFAFTVPGGPSAIKNIYHQDLGCAWLGVAGQAVDDSGAHVVGLIVKLGGALVGVPADEVTVTGSAASIGYGQSGWEFTLADRPVESSDTLFVQLFDQAENPLSDRIVFDTYDDCNRNLIVVNFVQTR